MGVALRIVEPADLFWRYLELLVELSSPSRVREPQQGFRYAGACRVCKETKRAWHLDAESGAGAYLCLACSAAWPVLEVSVLRIHVARDSSDPIAGRVEEVGRLERCIAGLPIWERRIWIELYLWDAPGSYRAVAKEANRRWPGHRLWPREPHRRWTEWRVRVTIASAERFAWSAWVSARSPAKVGANR